MLKAEILCRGEGQYIVSLQKIKKWWKENKIPLPLMIRPVT